MNVLLDINTRWAQAWVRLMSVVRYLIGKERAGDLAVWGAYRLVRFRIRGHRRWRRLPESR